jgi:hypothetical protein
MARILVTSTLVAFLATTLIGASQDQTSGQISGRVSRADDGSPIAKAEIALDAQDQQTSRGLGGGRIARSQPDGSFVFRDIPAGSYALRAAHNGFVGNSTRIQFTSARAVTVDLRLVAAGVMAGTVVDDDGDPVVHLDVSAIAVDFLPGDRRQLQLRARATTDDQGNFRIADLAPRSYLVRAGGPLNYPMQSVPLKQGPNGGTQYRDTYYPGTPLVTEAELIELAPGAERHVRLAVGVENVYTISGVVVNAAIDPQPEVQWYRPGDGEQMWCDRCSVSIERDGSFTIPRLPTGEYTLRAVAIDRQQGRSSDVGYASVQIADSDVRATIEAGRAAEVRGTIAGWESLRSARAQMFLQSRGMIIYPATIDGDGRFDIGTIPPGEYKLSVAGIGRDRRPTSTYIKRAMCGGKNYATEPLTLELGTTLTCEVALATDVGEISGRITDTDPAHETVVVIIPESRALRQMPRYTLSTTTTNGQYKVVGATPGDYYVFALPAREDHAYFDIDFVDRHRSSATRATVSPGSALIIDLKPLRPET